MFPKENTIFRIVDQLDDRKAVKSEISGGFSNKKSFSCPHAKPMLHTVYISPLTGVFIVENNWFQGLGYFLK